MIKYKASAYLYSFGFDLRRMVASEPAGVLFLRAGRPVCGAVGDTGSPMSCMKMVEHCLRRRFHSRLYATGKTSGQLSRRIQCVSVSELVMKQSPRPLYRSPLLLWAFGESFLHSIIALVHCCDRRSYPHLSVL